MKQYSRSAICNILQETAIAFWIRALTHYNASKASALLYDAKHLLLDAIVVTFMHLNPLFAA